MKRLLIVSAISMVGCLATTNHNPMTEKRGKGKLWWQQPQHAQVCPVQSANPLGVADVSSFTTPEHP